MGEQLPDLENISQSFFLSLPARLPDTTGVFSFEMLLASATLLFGVAPFPLVLLTEGKSGRENRAVREAEDGSAREGIVSGEESITMGVIGGANIRSGERDCVR